MIGVWDSLLLITEKVVTIYVKRESLKLTKE